MKNKKVIIAAALVVIVAVILVVRLSKKEDDGTISLSGNVEVTEANLGFKIPGRVVERLVDEGYRVKAGDILAKLDSAELVNLVKQNKAVLQEAATKLSELKAGSRNQEVEQGKAQVAVQEAELMKAKRDYERAEVLFKNGAISAVQFDTAKTAYEARDALLKNAREALSLIREGPRREDIKISEYRMVQAQAALAVSEEKLKDTILYAPFSGVILRKNIELGETVAQGKAVFTLGDLDNPWIKVYVKEDKLGIVRLGQKANITTDSHKNKTYEGTVTFISSEAEFTPKTVQTQEERVKLVFGVKVSVKNDGWDLKPGMPADVKLAVK